MQKLIIEGGNRLVGKVEISGAKNSAVALLPATLLADSGISTISNLPQIEDIQGLEETIKLLGATVTRNNNSISIDPKNLHSYEVTNAKVKEMRASYYFIAPILFKFGVIKLGFPGGCSIGARPIDFHLKVLEQLGATTENKHGVITISAPNGLVGCSIFFDTVSVGATINAMFAASKAKGITTLTQAAKEPHIIDVANFLNSMGAKISGAGTDIITIEGVEKLHGATHCTVPDQIEAGTYMIAAAATKGDVIVSNIIPSHLEFLTSKLTEMGALITTGPDYIRVAASETLTKSNIKTMVYPGFPTDLQQPMSTLLSICNGTSTVCEDIWENRFKFLNELQKMGVLFKIEGNIAIIDGIPQLSGAEVSSTDLRAGAAMVIAGLVADGTTTVSNIHYIDRGYEKIEEKLSILGAKIKRVSTKS